MKTRKTCTKCNQDKELAEFYKRKDSPDGLRNDCKECRKAYDREHYEVNREHELAYQKAYREENRDKISARKKLYYEENRERFSANSKVYYKKNREEIVARVADYARDRRANDSTYRWVHKLRNMLNHILHGRSSHPEALALLGCTGQEYRDHLESQFTDGMSWDNYGEWHVDHIIPVSAFDQSKLDERAICWHYSNTQPLWAEDNMAKGSKLPTESTNEQK